MKWFYSALDDFLVQFKILKWPQQNSRYLGSTELVAPQEKIIDWNILHVLSPLIFNFQDKFIKITKITPER